MTSEMGNKMQRTQKMAVAKQMLERLTPLMKLTDDELNIATHKLPGDVNLCLRLADIAATWTSRGGNPSRRGRHMSCDDQAMEQIRGAIDAAKIRSTNRVSRYSDWKNRMPGSYENPEKK